ncbi:hypothetical protein ACHAW6_000541 [Cyclotella cf. meneghiniana]
MGQDTQGPIPIQSKLFLFGFLVFQRSFQLQAPCSSFMIHCIHSRSGPN